MGNTGSGEEGAAIGNPHIYSEDYVQVRDGGLSAAWLALRIHDHLLAACPTCATTFGQLDQGSNRVRDLLLDAAQAGAVPEPPGPSGEPAPSTAAGPIPEEIPDHHLSCSPPEVRRVDEIIERIRTIRRRARKEVWRLRQLAPGERLATIRRASSQYRHRATAEFLLDRARELLHHDPAEAANLTVLVPTVVRSTPGAAEADWSGDLVALAEAWHATALRAAGDRTAADRAFSRQRRRLAREPVASNAVLAEIHAREAALRIEQRRFGEADELLDLATALLRQAGDLERLAHVLLRHGSLLQALGRGEQALHAFQSAERHLRDLPRTVPPRLAAVAGCIDQLAELGRPGRAEALLEAHLDALEDCGLLHAGPLVRWLRGRIALARGDLRGAEPLLRDAWEGHLTLGRAAEAALAGLDLADLYRQDRRPADLRTLAGDLLPTCRELGLSDEDLAGLRHLADGSLPADRSADAVAPLRQTLRLLRLRI